MKPKSDRLCGMKNQLYVSIRKLTFIAFVLALSATTGIADPSALSKNVVADITSTAREVLPGDFHVIFVKDKEVYVDVTKATGASLGDVYIIERLGAELTHPVTGAILGQTRDRIGKAKITWLQEGFSKAEIIEREGGAAVHVRDLVRSAEPAKIVRFPLRHEGGRVSKLTQLIDGELAAALSGIEQATVIEGGAQAVSSQNALSLAASAPSGAAVGIGGRIRSDGILEIHLVNLTSGAYVEGWEVRLDDSLEPLSAEKVTPRQTPRSGGFEQVEYQESDEIGSALNFVPAGMALGDLDGDGVEEVIFVDNNRLRIGKLNADGSFEQSYESKKYFRNALHVYAGDVDRDGSAEIYVTDKPSNFVRSFGYRFTDGKLDRFFRESNQFVRVVKADGRDRLYAQRYGHSRPFDNLVVEMDFDAEGDLVETQRKLPDDAMTIYGFAVLDGGKYASIDYENRLALIGPSGSAIWRSPVAYGGSDIKISSADKRNEEEIRTGVLTYDIDGDNDLEVIAVQNLLEGGVQPGFVRIGILQEYNQGRLVAFELENTGLVERWSTKSFSGVVKGFSIGNALGRGPEAVFFTVQKTGWNSRVATLYSVPLS